MTFLHQIQTLHNNYFCIRHGRSKANDLGIVLSDPEDGKLEEFSLTEEGEAQVNASTEAMKISGDLDENTLIVSSPFSRCCRTAEIVRDVLNIKEPIIFDDRLRERWFGNHERKSNTHYEIVWEDDRKDPNHTIANVESATDVQKRTASLIEELEKRYEAKNILLVSHGDALQIMQTAFAKQNAGIHRDLPHLETAEIRKLELLT